MQSFMLADFSGEKGDFLSFPRFSSISYIKYEAAFHHLQGQNSHFKLALLFFPSFVGAALLLLLGGKKASRNYYCPTSVPTENFTVSEPRNPPSDVFKLHRICQSAVFKLSNCRKSSVGLFMLAWAYLSLRCRQRGKSANPTKHFAISETESQRPSYEMTIDGC